MAEQNIANRNDILGDLKTGKSTEKKRNSTNAWEFMP